MDARTKGILTGAIGVLGGLGYLALTVYPFGYGMAESAALAGAFVIAGLYQTVLDDALSATR